MRAYQESVGGLRVPARRSGVSGRHEFAPLNASLPAQCPLASDNRVVAERFEPDLFRAAAAVTRGVHD